MKFIYGWSNLGNTQGKTRDFVFQTLVYVNTILLTCHGFIAVALGDLSAAEESYNRAVDLCKENLATTEGGFGVPKCNDLSILLLNRGSLRLNNGMQTEALNHG